MNICCVVCAYYKDAACARNGPAALPASACPAGNCIGSGEVQALCRCTVPVASRGLSFLNDEGGNFE